MLLLLLFNHFFSPLFCFGFFFKKNTWVFFGLKYFGQVARSVYGHRWSTKNRLTKKKHSNRIETIDYFLTWTGQSIVLQIFDFNHKHSQFSFRSIFCFVSCFFQIKLICKFETQVATNRLSLMFFIRFFQPKKKQATEHMANHPQKKRRIQRTTKKKKRNYSIH